jgi:hypothetical protein
MTTARLTALEKPATDLATECRLVQPPEILQAADREEHAASLKDEELIARVQTTFHNLRDNLPYLREARDRFTKPRRRVPVAGNPTWTEFVTANLGVSIRTVQRLLEEPKEKQERKIRPVQRLGDWQQAQRRINDFLTASTALFKKQPVGADVLIPALRELVAMAGCQLVEPTPKPEPRLEHTVGKVQGPNTARASSRKKTTRGMDTNAKVDDPKKAEGKRRKKLADELRKADIAKETNTIAAKHGWSVDERGESVYEGAHER